MKYWSIEIALSGIVGLVWHWRWHFSTIVHIHLRMNVGWRRFTDYYFINTSFFTAKGIGSRRAALRVKAMRSS